jgi:hypothetical protein
MQLSISAAPPLNSELLRRLIYAGIRLAMRSLLQPLAHGLAMAGKSILLVLLL